MPKTYTSALLEVKKLIETVSHGCDQDAQSRFNAVLLDIEHKIKQENAMPNPQIPKSFKAYVCQDILHPLSAEQKTINQLIDWAHGVEERFKKNEGVEISNYIQNVNASRVEKPEVFSLQIDMETPKIKSVEEAVENNEHIDEAADFAGSARVMHLPYVKKLLTQDRASLHTSLVAAVEGLKYQQPHVDTPFHTEDKIYAMNATLDQVLTIINSIFKE